jgi:hypothetical protein
MVKIRNLLKQVKERVEQELAQNENQQQHNTGSLFGGQNNNTQQTPSLFSSLSSSLERSIPSIATLNSSLQRSGLGDNNPRYVTVFCSTCLMIKACGGSGTWASIKLSDLESAAEDGCHFCSLLTQGLYGLIPDTKGKQVQLNLWSKIGWLEMKVIRLGERGEMIGSQGEWPIIEFLTTGRKSQIPSQWHKILISFDRCTIPTARN